MGVAGSGGGAKKDAAPRATEAKPTPSPRAAVADALHRVSTAGAATFTATAETGAPGDTDDTDNAAHMSGKVGPGAAEMSFSSSEISSLAPGLSSTMPLRQSGTSTYVDFGPRLGAATGGRRWLVSDMSEFVTGGTSEPLDVLFSQGVDPVGEGPAEQLGFLDGAQQVRYMGAEKTDGVVAGHYQGDVTADDIAKAGATMPGVEAARTKALAKQLDDSGLRIETIDLWLATSGPRVGYPVRLDLTLTTSSTITTDSIHYTAYESAPLRVAVPPKTQTVSTKDMDRLGGDADV
jgi:hypothetical protein